jgi:serine/threonine-protein kinase
MVADFGIALAVSAAAGGRMTETGLSLGTPHYMSPEQATAEKDITNRSDVYSLGGVLYEMLTGNPPHTGVSAQQIIMKIVTEEAAPVTQLRKSVPPHVAAAIAMSLEKLPADRFASAAGFGEALINPGAMSPTATTRHFAAVRHSAGWRNVALVSGALALGFGAFSIWALRTTSPQQVLRLAMAFPDGERVRSTGTHRVAMAPDGSRLVYVGPDSVGTRLWVRDMNALTARPLPGTNGALAPFFSPDGMSVGFFTGNPGDLRIVPVSGGAVRTVVQDSTTAWGGHWGDDGMLYYTNTSTRVARVAQGGGQSEVLSTIDTLGTGETEHDWVQPLPGGKAALVQMWYSSIADAAIGVLDFATGRATPLVDAVFARYAPTGHIIYATLSGSLFAARFDVGRREIIGATAIAEGVQVDAVSGSAQFDLSHTGLLVYMPGGGEGGQQVVCVDREGGVTAVDSTWRGNFNTVALSPDGSQIAVSVIAQEGEHIWIKRLPGGPLSRLTLGGTGNSRPTWTHDGRRVAFVSNRAGNGRQLYVQRSDGSADADSLMADAREVDQVVWTSDGRTFVYRTGSSGGAGTRDLYALTVGDSAPRALVSGPADEFAPDISPDGRWFVYVSNESGRNEVFVRRLDDPGAGRTQVSSEGGNEPRWAHNGRELFFRSSRGEMMVADVTLGSTFTARPPRVLFDLPNMGTDPFHRGYDVSLDDRRFLMINTAANDVTELVLVVNWLAELEQR